MRGRPRLPHVLPQRPGRPRRRPLDGLLRRPRARVDPRLLGRRGRRPARHRPEEELMTSVAGTALTDGPQTVGTGTPSDREGTVRLTTAQALVRWMVAQRSELLDGTGLVEGTVVPLFAGVFGIFGHGNVLGLGTALHAVRDRLPTWRGQTEEGMALAAVAYAKAMERRQVMVATSSIGPGALNMVTAAGVAHSNRLPVLLLSGDTFTNRRPDPVMQQVEHFGDPTINVNDAFKAVTRYWDRITHPEQIVSSLPQAVAVLLDPADCGPAFIALPQDVQEVAWDYPDAFFT